MQGYLGCFSIALNREGNNYGETTFTVAGSLEGCCVFTKEKAAVQYGLQNVNHQFLLMF